MHHQPQHQHQLLRWFEAIALNTIYSFSVIFTTDMGLFFYDERYQIKDLFSTYEVYFSSLLGTYYYLFFYNKIHSLMLEDSKRKNRFDWKLSFETFYTLGIFYSSAMFFPAILFNFSLQKIILITPASFIVLSIFETLQMLETLRYIYASRT
jgi:hypothetical protein